MKKVNKDSQSHFTCKMKKERFFGIVFILFSFFVLSLNLNFTGAVVGVSSGSLNFIAIIFLVVGSALLIHENKLEKLISHKFIDDPRRIKQIAQKMGYHDGREVKEGYQILKKGKPLTVIPRHHISKGVYHSIMNALSTGESNFRNYKSA
jgi:hypothetical protein